MRLVEGFTKQYNVDKLVYFEETSDVQAALHREKIIKKWKRVFKFDAIERMNPEWNDLHNMLMEAPQQVRGDSLV